MDIPTATTILQRMLSTPDADPVRQQLEAIDVALLCLKANHPQPTHAVICEDPELAKAISQDVNILAQLAFASRFTLNHDLKNASLHGSRALNSLRLLAEDPTYRVRLDALYD